MSSHPLSGGLARLAKPMHRGVAALGRLAGARSGASAVEFALIAPALFGLLSFLLTIGYTMVLGQTLDYATQKAARKIRTGTVQSAGLTRDQFRTTIVCANLPSLFSCDDVIVNVQQIPPNASSHPNEYYGFVNANQTALIVPNLTNATASYCPGKAQTYVYLQVLYPASLLASMFTPSIANVTYNGQNRYLLMATATFLNEPFGSGGSSC